MLGLKRGSVVLCDHDPSWASEFLLERERLRRALGDIGCVIEHIGSTAVSGLPSKPILDIAVGVLASVAPEVCIARLQACGYEYRGNAGAGGGHVLVLGPEERRTHHLHIVELGGVQWNAYLALRNLLRTDSEARTSYAAVKGALAQRFPEDRKSYTDGKDEIIARLVARAAHGPA